MGIGFVAVAVVLTGLIAGLAALPEKQLRRAEVSAKRTTGKR